MAKKKKQKAAAKGIPAKAAEPEPQPAPASSTANVTESTPTHLSPQKLDAIVATFPAQELKDPVVLPELEVDHDSLDARYLLEMLEQRGKRLQTGLKSLLNVYRDQVHLYKEYQSTYSVMTTATAADGA